MVRQASRSLGRQRLAGSAAHVFVVAGLVGLAVGAVRAQPRLPAPHEVEAAYLFQFGKYVEWPPTRSSSGDNFVICVLGADPFAGALDEIVRGKAIDDHHVEIQRIVGPSESRECRILFVSPSEDSRLPAILKAVQGTGILTVGRGSQFTRRGGMIAFTSEERKVRFVVNLAATEAGNLRLSSQLLRVALSVER